MNTRPPTAMATIDLHTTEVEAQRLDTRRAFDSVAAAYDGPLGNNALIQRMRQTMWERLTATFSRGARLLDLGCGTGLDAAYLATQGLHVLALDSSPLMVARTRSRIDERGLSDRVTVQQRGIHELDALQAGTFDGIYSNLGPLNCVSDLAALSEGCAALLRPRGALVASVIGRICPWEKVYYLARRDRQRASVRQAREAVPVSLNGNIVWTRYYRPREFYRSFSDAFELAHYQALSLFLPPPYLIRLYEPLRPLFRPVGWLDDHLGAWPLLRNAGDHFLMVLTRRD